MIVKLCNAQDLPAEGTMKAFKGAGKEICVARIAGSLHAVDNHCPHQAAPLSQGSLEGGHIICPYHAWRFDIVTGEPEVDGDPPLVCYQVRQYNDEIFIRLPLAR